MSLKFHVLILPFHKRGVQQREMKSFAQPQENSLTNIKKLGFVVLNTELSVHSTNIKKNSNKTDQVPFFTEYLSSVMAQN